MKVIWTQLANKLDRIATGKVLFWLLIASALFSCFIFPYRTRTLTAISGETDPTLDGNFFYTPQQAYHLFDKLEPSGRQIYAWTELSVDLVFPILYSLFFCLLLIYIYRRFSSAKVQRRLIVLPLAAMIFDYCENFLIAFLLFAYPQVHMATAYVAGLFTLLKSISLLLTLIAVIVGLVLWLWNHLANRRSGARPHS